MSRAYGKVVVVARLAQGEYGTKANTDIDRVHLLRSSLLEMTQYCSTVRRRHKVVLASSHAAARSEREQFPDRSCVKDSEMKTKLQ